MDVDVNDYIEALKLQVAANGDDAAKLKAYAKGLERKVQELEAKLAERDMPSGTRQHERNQPKGRS